MINYITFNGVPSTEFDLYVGGQFSFKAPRKDIVKVDIPGRNGDLIFDNGTYSNIEITYVIVGMNNFKSKINLIKDWLLSPVGYTILEDTYDTDHYRYATLASGIDFIMSCLNKFGKANIIFDCKPQRFLNSGDTVTALSASGTLTNPTPFNAKPLIVCTGAGTLTIKSQTITVASGLSPITIDCENMDCYSGTTNANSYVTFSTDDFPVLEPGANAYSRTGFSSVKVTPRWWRL